MDMWEISFQSNTTEKPFSAQKSFRPHPVCFDSDLDLKVKADTTQFPKDISDISGILCKKKSKIVFFHREKLYIGTDVSFPLASRKPNSSRNFYWKHQTWPNRLVILTITWDEMKECWMTFCFPFFWMTQIKSRWECDSRFAIILVISQPWNVQHNVSSKGDWRFKSDLINSTQLHTDQLLLMPNKASNWMLIR